MTTIELRFPARRFHATPWGRHVNEGVPEWPPSPYRLLRSLYDAWKRKNADLAEPIVAEVLKSLSAEPPRFALPQATTSHTRSYLNSNTEDPTDKSLIFDAFVAVNPGARCYLTWPSLDLPAPQRDVLQRLLQSINYVGRSESWVEAAVFEGTIEAPIRCEPLTATEQSGDVVPVACPTSPAEYKETKPWLDAIAYSTAEFLKDRRNVPPAMRMVQYVRPADALLAYVPKPPKQHAGTQAVMLGLHATVLPLIISTVEVAEQIRSCLMGSHKKLMGDETKVSPMFSGKAPDGTPLTGHQHTFILPLGNDHGRIDRVLIYTRSKSGFNGKELQAILRINWLYQRDRDEGIRAVATWKGSAASSPIWSHATRVVSTTPFVAGRHWRKGRGSIEDFLVEEVRRECRNHGLLEPDSIKLTPSPWLFEWVEFRRNRKDHLPQPGFGFELEFSRPVCVPFSLGYGCHFGLGQFAGVK